MKTKATKLICILLAVCLLCLAGCKGGEKKPDGPSVSAAPQVSQSDESSGPEESSEAGGKPSTEPTKSPADYKGTLSVYAWRNAFPQSVLDAFTEETGYRVTCSEFDYDETMLERLRSTGGGDYDIVIADDYILEAVIAEELAKKLDGSKLKNLGNVEEPFRGLYYDPQNTCTVAFGAAAQTIVYDPEALDVDITGYGSLWDSGLAGKLGVVSNQRVTVGIALKAIGESFNCEDSGAIASAGEKLLALAPNIASVDSSSLVQALTDGDISAAVMFTSQIVEAKKAMPGLKVVFPSEGTGFGVQALFIPAKAPTEEAAYAFIDHLLRPESAAECARHMGVCSTVKGTAEHLPEELRDTLSLPAGADPEKLEMIRNVSDAALDEYYKIWEAFRAACGY